MSATTDTKPEKLPKKMTATERKEIRNIVKKEFELLRKELNNHAEDIIAQTRKEVRESFKPKQKEATKASERLQTEARKFEDRMNKMVEEYHAKGVEPGWGYKFKVDVPREWRPINLTEAMSEAERAVRTQLREAVAHLDRQEHEFDKEISLNALVTAEAMEFVAKIPKPEQLLQLDKKLVTAAITVKSSED